MIIDVLINSCARPDLLEESMESFHKHIKTNKHSFRHIIVEDKVDNINRQEQGLKWINEHSNLFDKIIFQKEILGTGYWWANIIRCCDTNFHFHMEDDCKFITDINIDPIIDVMLDHENFIEIIFRRDTHKLDLPENEIIIDNLNLTEISLMSTAPGLFNTSNVIKLINRLGWETQLHEFSNLTPTTKLIGLKKFTLDHKTVHYIHTGEKKCYRKGGWIKPKEKKNV